MSTVLIYKISPRPEWDAAVQAGTFTGAPVDLADGFIHFSTAEQVAETAMKHFRGHGDLVLVAVDSAALGAQLKWEPSRGGALFPHLYGPLDVAHALMVVALELGDDGVPVIPDLEDHKARAGDAGAR